MTNYENGGIDGAADTVASFSNLNEDEDRRAYMAERIGVDPGYSSNHTDEWGAAGPYTETYGEADDEEGDE